MPYHYSTVIHGVFGRLGAGGLFRDKGKFLRKSGNFACSWGIQVNAENPGGIPRNSLQWCAARPVLQILTLFQTKICHFCIPVLVGETCRCAFLETPETVRAHFGCHNFLGVLKTNTFPGMTFCNKFALSYLEIIVKGQVIRISE